jgi:multicomponent Na+:H+ antiporter subunit D
MLLALPLAIPWFGAVLLAPFDGRRARTGWIAVGLLVAQLAAMGALALDVLDRGARLSVAGGWPAGVGILVRADSLGVTFATLSIAVLLAALLFEVMGGVESRSFPALVLFLSAGLTGLFLTGDAFNFYVFFEISMIAAYILSSYGEEARQLRAAANFAVVNLLGSVLFLISIASLYHVTGRLDMPGIAQRMPVVESSPAILTATLIFVAFSIKLGLFPFHFWLATVYTGTRPAVAAILSGALANIGSYGLLRFGGELLPRELEEGSWALFVLGTCSIVYGALQAISRRPISEVLAYSSIGQAGYIILALGLGGQIGFEAVVLFAVANSLSKALLFLSEHLRGWMMGAIFAIGAFSVAGIPPAGGFIAKAAIFRAALDERSAWLAGLLLAAGALSLVYVMQLYVRHFWAAVPDAAPASPARTRALVGTLAASLLAIGLWPQPLLHVSQQAAAVLVAASP